MEESFQKKCAALKEKFKPLSAEARYRTLMEMGRSLPPFPEELKTPDRLVRGCQSLTFLHACLQGDRFFFSAHSDALISAGLAALLIEIYSGETAETVLTCPPLLISELEISASLSPGRSNGLAHIYLRMKQEALKFFKTSTTFC